jgi:hypothetical protein
VAAKKKSARKAAKTSNAKGKKGKGKKKAGNGGGHDHGGEVSRKKLADAITTILEMGYPEGHCNLPDICSHLKELSIWLRWFDNDYTRLREAVCNVERKAWNEGTATNAKRFCTPNSGIEPEKPKKPPVWT